MSSIKLLPKALELAQKWTKNPGLGNPIDPAALLKALEANVSGHSTIPETFEKACIERVNHLAMNCESQTDQTLLLEAAGYPDLKSLQDAGQRIAEQAEQAVFEAQQSLYGEGEPDNRLMPYDAEKKLITPTPAAIEYINAKMAELDGRHRPRRDSSEKKLTERPTTVFEFCEAIRLGCEGTPGVPETFEEDYFNQLKVVLELVPEDSDKENLLAANWLHSKAELDERCKALIGSAKKIKRELEQELGGPVI